MRQDMRTACKALDKGEEDDVMVHLEWMRYGLVMISSGQRHCQSNPYRLDQKELDGDQLTMYWLREHGILREEFPLFGKMGRSITASHRDCK